MTNQSQKNRCYSAALKMLMRREHSQLELLKKLQLKGFDDGTINSSISLLAEQNCQSDERFSEAFILMRYNQGKGPLKIAFELKARGINKFNLTAFDWSKLAKEVRIKKFGHGKSLDFKDQVKQKRSLQSRIFGFNEIIQAF